MSNCKGRLHRWYQVRRPTPCGVDTAPRRLTTRPCHSRTRRPPRPSLPTVPPGVLLPSRFAHTLNADSPLPEYPRPHLQRPRWLSLNGWWEWQEVRTSIPLGTPLSRRVRVPFPVESALSGLGFGGALAGGATRMRYRRAFTLPAKWGWPDRCTVRLHFGAVDWAVLVYVDGVRAAVHAGGFTPFSVDIDAALHRAGGASPAPARQHWLEVQVADPTGTQGQPLGKQRALAGGIWYTAVSGIWGTVWLEPLPLAASVARATVQFEAAATPAHAGGGSRGEQSLRHRPVLARVAVRPSWRHGVQPADNLTVRVALHDPLPPGAADAGPGSESGWWPPPSSPAVASATCALDPFPPPSSKLLLPSRRTAARAAANDTRRPIPPDEAVVDANDDGLGGSLLASCSVELRGMTRQWAARVWSPESPALYGVVVSLHDARGAVVDRVLSYAGLRTVGIAPSADGGRSERVRTRQEPSMRLRRTFD